jgi:hypothetical protein
MMRNTDRAMSNIEASPEGFNMLRRMYGTVQAPLLSAATMGGEGGNDLATNPLQLSWAQKGLHKNIAKLKAQSTLVQHNYGLGLLFHTQHLFQILGTLQQLVHMEGQSVRHQLELYQQQLQVWDFLTWEDWQIMAWQILVHWIVLEGCWILTQCSRCCRTPTSSR